jgi:hypothetical protein
LRLPHGGLTAASWRIIGRKFEWQFKYRDESNLKMRGGKIPSITEMPVKWAFLALASNC